MAKEVKKEDWTAMEWMAFYEKLFEEKNPVTISPELLDDSFAEDESGEMRATVYIEPRSLRDRD